MAMFECNVNSNLGAKEKFFGFSETDGGNDWIFGFSIISDTQIKTYDYSTPTLNTECYAITTQSATGNNWTLTIKANKAGKYKVSNAYSFYARNQTVNFVEKNCNVGDTIFSGKIDNRRSLVIM